jgi:hypothetical protein
MAMQDRYKNAPIKRSDFRLPPDGQYGDKVQVRREIIVAPEYFSSAYPGRFEITILSIGPLNGPNKSAWMSDSPQEIAMMRCDASHFRKGGRRILVCGLGLGMFPQLVEEKYDEVVIVEKNPAVVKATWEHVRALNWRLVIADAWDIGTLFCKGSFDAVYADIWVNISGDNVKHYKAFKKIARHKLGSPNTHCWWEHAVYGRDL